MPYRDELEALRARVETLEREHDALEASLARARAALACVSAELAGAAPQADVPWRSLPGGEPVLVTFVSARPRKVTIFSLSPDGRPRREATVVPGGRRAIETHTGCLLRVEDG